jgi:alpha/beta superfamily hydrolase
MSLSEQTVFLIAGSLRLESLLHLASGPDAVVITHPHSLYGGEMDNPVVATLTGVYQRLGYTTLRFNFRGVGASGGGYDDGRGEQDDVRAAAAYLAGLGRTVTDLAGYSFGAWINLRLNPPVATVRRQVLVAPPVAYLEFGSIAAPPAELVVITGDRDRIAPPELLREQAPGWGPAVRLRVLPGVDHFFGGALERLAALVETELAAPENR